MNRIFGKTLFAILACLMCVTSLKGDNRDAESKKPSQDKVDPTAVVSGDELRRQVDDLTKEVKEIETKSYIDQLTVELGAGSLIVTLLIAISGTFFGYTWIKGISKTVVQENDDVTTARLYGIQSYIAALIQWDRSETDGLKRNEGLKLEDHIINFGEMALEGYRKVLERKSSKERFYVAANNLLFWYAIFYNSVNPGKYEWKAGQLYREWLTFPNHISRKPNRRMSAMWVEITYPERIFNFPRSEKKKYRDKIEEILDELTSLEKANTGESTSYSISKAEVISLRARATETIKRFS
jgi:hypothetical protein